MLAKVWRWTKVLKQHLRGPVRRLRLSVQTIAPDAPIPFRSDYDNDWAAIGLPRTLEVSSRLGFLPRDIGGAVTLLRYGISVAEFILRAGFLVD